MNARDRRIIARTLEQLAKAKAIVLVQGVRLRLLSNRQHSEFDNMNDEQQASDEGQATHGDVMKLDEAASGCEHFDISALTDPIDDMVEAD